MPKNPDEYDIELGPVPIAPDGGIAQGFAAEAPAPVPSMSESICARGPCRHFWHLVTPFDAGNPEGTWEALGTAAPTQHSYSCMRHPGSETDLGDTVVLNCNQWDPLTPGELEQLNLRKHLVRAPEPQEEIPADANDDE